MPFDSAFIVLKAAAVGRMDKPAATITAIFMVQFE